MSQDQDKIFSGKVIGVLPARWGSKRFPGKMLAQISGKTVISRTYLQACQATLFDHIAIATDDVCVYDHIIDLGGTAFMTSPFCKNGSERTAEVINKHYPEAEIIVNIQGDEPFVDPKTLDALIRKMQQTPEADLVTPICRKKSSPKELTHGTIKCVINNAGEALYFSRSPIPAFYSENAEQEFYVHIGLYCFRRQLLLEYPQLKPGKLTLSEDLEQLRILENEKKIYTIFTDQKSISIDCPEDIKTAEEYLSCHSHVYS